jgi:hypothetical protein
MSSKLIRDTDTRRLVQWAISLGFTVEHGRKHSKLHLPLIGKHIVFGCTPSDHRALDNFRARIRRLAREAGVPA